MPHDLPLKVRLLPMALALAAIVLDQAAKAAVVAAIPIGAVGASFFDDFLRIIHVRNPGVAFSLGGQLDAPLRTLIFTVGPLVILPVIAYYAIAGKDLLLRQRWFLAGIVGGGLGNLIDRIFRPGGVVDFIDVRFFGIFGWERWPTFNVADSFVVVCAILLFATLILPKRKTK